MNELLLDLGFMLLLVSGMQYLEEDQSQLALQAISECKDTLPNIILFSPYNPGTYLGWRHKNVAKIFNVRDMDDETFYCMVKHELCDTHEQASNTIHSIDYVMEECHNEEVQS